MINIKDTPFPEVKIFFSDDVIDNRGMKYITYSDDILKKSKISFSIKQEVIYQIEKKDTIYGIHYQSSPKQQSKIVSIIQGKGTDYIIDLRRKSSNYRKWISLEISSNNHFNIYIPKGFGHLFRSLTNDVVMLFRIDEYFEDKYSGSISYKDTKINLDIRDQEFIASEYDLNAPILDISNCNL